MEDILEKLAQSARKRVAAQKEDVPLPAIITKARSVDGPSDDYRVPFAFAEILKKPGLSFICEIKKASPSKGVIDPVFDYMGIAREYEAAGADAISCLTEPEYFLGSGTYIQDIAKEVSVPVLRKDFIIDEYMIYESKIMGASAILLICSLLDDSELGSFIELAHSLNMSVLAEARTTEDAMRAIMCGAGIIGVNNRNLRDFSVDKEFALKLRDVVPPNVLFVAESGISTREDVLMLENAGVDGVLIGEALMKASDKTAKIRQLKGLC